VQTLGWTLLAMGVWGAGGLLLAGRRWPVRVLASLLALIWIVQGLLINPLLSDSSSGRGLMREVGQRIGPGAELGLVAWKEQNLLMTDRAAITFGFKRPWEQQLQAAVVWQAQYPQRRWLLVQEKALLSCVDRSRSQRVGTLSGRGWWLVPAGAIEGACIATPAQREVARRDQGPP
jgi:hypothetical protein